MRFENLETMEVSRLPIQTKSGAKIYRHPSLFTKNEEKFYGVIPVFTTDKSIVNNQDLQIRKITSFDLISGEIKFLTTIGEEFKSSVLREKGYFESMGMTETEFSDWLASQEGRNYFDSSLNETLQYLTIDLHENVFYGSISKYLTKSMKQDIFSQIANPKQAYIAKIYDRNDGGFFCKINGIECYMPGSLAAANKISNFDSLLNTEVIVMIEDFVKSSDIFIVSHKKYINWILPSAVKKLSRNVQYEGHVTGASKHGIFVEFDKIFTGLIAEKELNTEILAKYQAREIKPGDSIKIYIKAIERNHRIHLSTFSNEERRNAVTADNIEDLIEENLEGKVFLSEIKQIKPFGALVKIEPIEQWCLLSQKEILKNKNVKFKVGDKIYLTVDRVNTDTGKINMKFMR